MRTVAAVVALVACVHAGCGYCSAIMFARPTSAASWPAFLTHLLRVRRIRIPALSPATAQIRADLKLLAPLTRAIRTYSATGGVELVPGIATEFGLRVTAGAWIDKNQDRNEREIRSVIDLAKRHSNINGIIVGNETIFRGEQKVSDLIENDSARQALYQRSGDDGRNLARMDRASRACFRRRLHRRPHSSLLGRILGDAGC